MASLPQFLMRWAYRLLMVGGGIAWPLEAQRPTPRPSEPQAIADRLLDRSRLDASLPIDFHAAVLDDTVYVNEQVTWQAAVLINQRIRDRLRQNPEFVPPALEGVLAFDLVTPTRRSARLIEGTPFMAYLFRRALFPIAPGRLRIPSPQLTYRLPPNASYFSREQTFTVSAESAFVVVRPIPQEGRPADFTGAVGQFSIASRLEADSARRGEPLLLTIRVSGSGNVALLSRPVVSVPWGTTVPGGERVMIDSSTTRVRGTKEFDIVITPHDTGLVEVPALSYAYFDPARRAFAEASTSPLRLRIQSGAPISATRGSATAADVAASTGADDGLRPWSPSARETVRRRFVRDGGWIWWAVAPVLSLAMMGWRHRRRARATRITPHRSGIDEEHASGAQPRRLRRELLAYLGERLDVAPSDLVEPRRLRRTLRIAGVSRDLTDRVASALERLAEDGFSGQPHPGTSPIDEAVVRSLREQVDAEAIARPRVPVRRSRVTGATVLLVVLGTLSAPEGQTQSPRMAIGEGDLAALIEEATTAFARQDFPGSARIWARAAEARPHDIVLLANWGEAAWRAGDTVTAVVAWHRAMREAPMDGVLRDRMRVLPPGAREGWALVPMLDASWMTAIGLLVWGIGWFLLPWRARERRLSALVVIAAGGAAGLAGWWLSARSTIDDIAVVAAPVQLREVPVRDAPTSGGIGTGELVRRMTTRDGWHRVQATDGRSGWIPTSPPIVFLGDPANR